MSPSDPERPWQPRKHDDPQRMLNPFERSADPERLEEEHREAAELDPQSSEAHLWLGLALRKANRNAEARREFQKSLDLNPARVWTRQQLEKTPAQ